MTLSLTVVSVRKISGRIYITFSDGSQADFGSLVEAQNYANKYDPADVIRRMGIRRYLIIDPTASTPSLIEGHSVTYTDQSNSMVSVS